jgi:hypothetical protein
MSAPPIHAHACGATSLSVLGILFQLATSHFKTGAKYCALHSERGAAALLGSKGGRRRTIYRLDGLKKFPAPKSAADLQHLALSTTIAANARIASMSSRTASAPTA